MQSVPALGQLQRICRNSQGVPQSMHAKSLQIVKATPMPKYRVLQKQLEDFWDQ